LEVLHNDELYNIDSSLNIIGQNKSRRMRCAQAERERCIQGFDGSSLRGRDHVEDLELDGRTILK